MTRLNHVFIAGALTFCLGLSAAPKKEATPENPATAIPGTNGIPDLTKGGKLTELLTHWVGPIGSNIGSWNPWNPRKWNPTDVRQLMVLQIEKGSPADGVLRYHDVILGADGSGAAEVPKFVGTKYPFIEIGNAITEAEAHDPAILKLLVWRPANAAPAPVYDPKKPLRHPRGKDAYGGYTEGKMMTLTLTLKTFGRYSDTAPYNCDKSKKILRQGLKALYESDDPGVNGFGALCLLAGDDPTNPDNDKYQAKAKEWIYKMVENKKIAGPWFSGPKLITLSEYYIKTKDEAVFPELVKRAKYHANGVSWLGTTGHRWADRQPDGTAGKMGGYGSINGSGVLGFLGLTLARKAGVKSPIVEHANKRQRIFFGHYENKGNIIYGEYPYGVNGGVGDENGRHAIPALALGLLGKEKKAKYFTRMTALADVKWRTYGHGGPFMAQVFQPLAVAQGGVKANSFYFPEIRWHLDLKRNWDGRRLYDGREPYPGFSRAATALLFYALPLKQLTITGRDRNDALELTEAEYAETVATKAFDPKKLSDDELIASLSKYLGMLRGVAAYELSVRVKDAERDNHFKARKEGKREPSEASEKAKGITSKVIALAGDKTANPIGRAGACRVLMDIKFKAFQEPLKSLMNAEIAKTGVSMLKESDPYIRFAGTKILEIVPPEEVKPYGNDIMDVILAIDRPTFPLDEENPGRWDHGAISMVFAKQVLSQGVDDLDRKKLIPVLRSMLKTPMSVYRTEAAKGLFNISKEDTLCIADNVILAMETGSPFGVHDLVSNETQKLLAKHHFEEGLFLSLRSHPDIAIKGNIPKAYGQTALRMQSIRDVANLIGEAQLLDGIAGMDKVLPQLLEEKGPETLNKMKEIRTVKAAEPTLKLPAARTELVADAINYALHKAEDTTYTWRKVYGAGKVSFTPNGSYDSHKTTVSFVDKKPGTYRFEVTMADSLGINTVSRTVEVTLNDSNGKLPANRPPRAESQSLKAVPGLPTRVVLTGSDPDGDDLGFRVTRQPAHGRIDGDGGDVTYTAEFGFNGTDKLTFEAIDGQGKTASGTVTFTVSDKDVGVAIYEGFDYPAGCVIGRTDGRSFGFQGPWKLKDNIKTPEGFVLVEEKRESLTYASLPATGGKLVKGTRFWPMERALDPQVLADHKLLDNGQVLWLSIFMVPAKGANSSSVVSLIGGDGLNLGFIHHGHKGTLSATYNGEKVGESRDPVARGFRLRGLWNTDNSTMFVMRCTWGKTDAGVDRFEVFRVFDAPGFGPMLVKNPICVFEQVIPQKKFNAIRIGSEQPVDEIRIGTTLHSVLVGTKPLRGK